MIDYATALATVVLLFGAMAASFNLLIGFGRLFSIAHAAFVGIGAYSVAVGTIQYGLPWWLSALIGIALATLIGFFIGFLALRVADHYLAIATFAFSFVFTVGITNVREITGGASGLSGVPPPQIAGLVVESKRAQLVLAALVLGLTIEVGRRLKTSPFGLILRAAGQDDLAAQALGKRTKASKISIHALAGGLAALAGAVYAGHIIFILPAMFDIHFSILLLSMVMIGGAGSLFGPLVGAIIMVVIPDLLNFVGVTNSTVANVRQLLFAFVLLAVVLGLQRGVLKDTPFRARLSEPADDSGPPDGLATARLSGARAGSRIDCMTVAKSFGGIRAVGGVTTSFTPGRVTGIVGPNGAGKTTLFDLITGFQTPDSGEVKMDNVALDGTSPGARCRSGLIKSFQDLRLFPQMTALENVMIAIPLGRDEGMLTALLRRNRTKQALGDSSREAAAILQSVGLPDWEREADELSYAEQKLLSLARVLASRPSVILLDEPASGLDPHTLTQMSELVRSLAASGCTVVVVEHNTQALAEMADHMVFLHLGEVIDEGPPEQIMKSEQLAAIYFGTESKAQ